MSNEGRFPLSIPASADLSASQYCAVALDANGNLITAGAGLNCIGILYTKPNALGRAGTVMPKGSGRVKAKLGGTVTLGAALVGLKVAAGGVLITGVIGTDVIVAYALQSGVINDIAEVLLT